MMFIFSLLQPIPRPLLKAFIFLKGLASAFKAAQCGQTASSLSFTTLLALVPLLTITLVIASAFPVFLDVTNTFKGFLFAYLVPEFSGKIVTVYVKQFAENAKNLTMAGMLILILTAFMMLSTIERTFNQIWKVQIKRPLLTSLLTYWAILTLGPLFLGASLSFTAALVELKIGFLKIFPLVMSGISFTLLYYGVPNCRVRIQHALIGGMLTGFCFELMKALFGLYVRQFASYKLVYGAFASVPVFLMWLYVAWLLILWGAVLTAYLQTLSPADA